MPVDERTRRVMTEALVRVFGAEVTDALLAHLPPVGWADVATKQDLAALKAGMEAALHREIAVQTRIFALSMIMLTAAIAALT